MSELAFNANGESFEIPATVTGWRVRRMKPRGAPELVYGKDGRPLTLGIEADIDELRDAVGSAGKYRLDPINDDGKCVENVPAAYVHVVKPRDIDEDDEADVVTAAPASPSFEFLNNLIAQVVPLVVTGLAGKKMKLSSVLDWRKASAEAQDEKQQPPALATTTTAEAPKAKEASPGADALPPIDPQMMAHFIAIQSALKPDEAALARQVASELAPAELRAWIDDLGKLSVPQAVQKIRVLIAGNTEAVS